MSIQSRLAKIEKQINPNPGSPFCECGSAAGWGNEEIEVTYIEPGDPEPIHEPCKVCGKPIEVIRVGFTDQT